MIVFALLPPLQLTRNPVLTGLPSTSMGVQHPVQMTSGQTDQAAAPSRPLPTPDTSKLPADADGADAVHGDACGCRRCQQERTLSRMEQERRFLFAKTFPTASLDGYIKALPVEGIPWQPTETKAHQLYTADDIELICHAAKTASKNGEVFADYIRLLAACGAREQETIKLRWDDVDFSNKLLTIGADGDTKNREARRVDFNQLLEAHLKHMKTRRAPDSQWLFPSPQRGERDDRSKTFRESLKLARAATGWKCRACDRFAFADIAPLSCAKCGATRLEKSVLPVHIQRFGFHDCRHHFISYAVMSGIDFMTIARWVGHKDGGILIGKVYGHLSNEHAQRQASRLSFRISPAPSA